MPGFSVRVLARKSSRGTVYCKKASAGRHTACSRPPARSPSTARRRYSYSRPVPSMGRSTRSRAGNTAAAMPRVFRSAAKRVASASPGVTTHSGRPVSRASAASIWAQPAGGSPKRAAVPGVSAPASNRLYSPVFAKSACSMAAPFKQKMILCALCLKNQRRARCDFVKCLCKGKKPRRGRRGPADRRKFQWLYLFCASLSLPFMIRRQISSRSARRPSMAVLSSPCGLPSTQSARS